MPSQQGSKARYDAVQTALAEAEAEYEKNHDLNSKQGMAAYSRLGEARLNAKAVRKPRELDSWPASKRPVLEDPGFSG